MSRLSAERERQIRDCGFDQNDSLTVRRELLNELENVRIERDTAFKLAQSFENRLENLKLFHEGFEKGSVERIQALKEELESRKKSGLLKIMQNQKRSKEEIDNEYKNIAINFGDREYKIKCLKNALQPLERDAALLFERMNQINLEVARDYPELSQQLPKPPEEPKLEAVPPQPEPAA